MKGKRGKRKGDLRGEDKEGKRMDGEMKVKKMRFI